MKVLDADAHVHEWEGAFSDKYFQPSLGPRRPTIVQGPYGIIQFLIDGKIAMPTFRKGMIERHFATPASINDHRVNTYIKKPESLECLELRGAEARLQLMDEEGIEMQVIYPTLFLAWPLADDPIVGGAICHSYNNWIADVCSHSGERLKWVAVIDPADAKAAAGEIARCAEMGSLGVMVLGMVGDLCISDPPFEPVWDMAAQLHQAVAVHVGDCTPLGHINFFNSLLMGFHGVMHSGLLDRYPDLKVAFLEAGCSWLPYMLARMEDLGERVAALMNPEWRYSLGKLNARIAYRSRKPPEEYIKSGNLYFGFEVDEKLFPYCLEQFGPDCWLWASDIPHGDRLPNAARILASRKDIDAAAKQKLLYDNCVRFYNLDSK